MEYKEFMQKYKVNFGFEPDITEETYNLLEDIRIKEKEIEKEIDALAEKYAYIKDNNICGYYAILEYCLQQIKANDKNMQFMLANPNKKRDDNER